MSAAIYLDNLASTPLAPRARRAMARWLEDDFGNASSSTHEYGWRAAQAVQEAREQLARLIGARLSSEVVFTSGATESNNTVLKGIVEAFPGSASHIVTSAIEHSSIIAPCQVLAGRGASVTQVRPDSEGIIHPEEVQRAIRKDTRVISVMAVNNEIGTVQPVAEIAQIARSHGALLHVDASQAVAKLDIDVERLGVDLMSISAHKLNGPKGVGALYIRSGALPSGLPPLMHGGGQELGRRAGTLPVAQIVGFGEAARLALLRWREDMGRVDELTRVLWDRLRSAVCDIQLNGSAERRVPGCLNFSAKGVPSDALIAATPELALSSGSACSSEHGGDSHVLEALGFDAPRRRGAVRVGIGPYNTTEEVRIAGELIAAAIARIRDGNLG
ncbi:MAG TPA: cysteine desulfurase family protein [Solirubrobacteraceae bacterium]